jgi:hypothetical protein
VHIYKAGTDDEASRPDDAPALRLGNFSHGRDPIPVNRDVPMERRGSTAIHDACTRDDQIKHDSLGFYV